VLLNWNPLLWSNYFNAIDERGEGVSYTVVITKDQRARLDSQCALRKEVSTKFIVSSFEEQNTTSFFMKTPLEGQIFYVNVIAKVQIPGDEPDIVPYTSRQIVITAPGSSLSLILLGKPIILTSS
jgi:hypothetical protein